MDALTTSFASKRRKPNNILKHDTSAADSFFAKWCEYLCPTSYLTKREISVLSSLLKHRWLLSKTILDPVLLDRDVMNDSTREKVLEELNITKENFYVIKNNLQKKNIIVDGTLNPKVIPNIRPDDNGCFQLVILLKDPA
jgi:hypothetical protein